MEPIEVEDEILGSILRAVGAGRAVHWLPYTALSEATLAYPDPGAVPRRGAGQPARER